jgi:hypothetical protein
MLSFESHSGEASCDLEVDLPDLLRTPPVNPTPKMSLKLILARLLYYWKALFENPVELFNRIGVGSTDHILKIGCAIGYHTTALAQVVRGCMYGARRKTTHVLCLK